MINQNATSPSSSVEKKFFRTLKIMTCFIHLKITLPFSTQHDIIAYNFLVLSSILKILIFLFYFTTWR